MKSPLLWVGLFAHGCNLILGSPAAAQAVIEPEAGGTPWTGEMGVRESTAQLMARQYTSNLDEPLWSDLGNDVTANGSTATQTDVTTSGTERYYRVVLLP